jgi:hypothetical protein
MAIALSSASNEPLRGFAFFGAATLRGLPATFLCAFITAMPFVFTKIQQYCVRTFRPQAQNFQWLNFYHAISFNNIFFVAAKNVADQ